MTSDNFWWFSTPLPKYHVRWFLTYNFRFFGVILDPLPTLKLDVINGRSLTALNYFFSDYLGAFKCCKSLTSLAQTWCLQKLMALLHCFHLILCKMLGDLFCSIFDIFPRIFDNLGKRHAWSWVLCFLPILLCRMPGLSSWFL